MRSCGLELALLLIVAAAALGQESRPSRERNPGLALEAVSKRATMEPLEPLEIDAVLRYSGSAPMKWPLLKREHFRVLCRKVDRTDADPSWVERQCKPMPFSVFCGNRRPPAPSEYLLKNGSRIGVNLWSYEIGWPEESKARRAWFAEPGDYELKVDYSPDEWKTRLSSRALALRVQPYPEVDRAVVERVLMPLPMPDFPYLMLRYGAGSFCCNVESTPYIEAAETILRWHPDSRFVHPARLLLAFEAMMAPGPRRDLARADELLETIVATCTDKSLLAFAKSYREAIRRQRP